MAVRTWVTAIQAAITHPPHLRPGTYPFPHLAPFPSGDSSLLLGRFWVNRFIRLACLFFCFVECDV